MSRDLSNLQNETPDSRELSSSQAAVATAEVQASITIALRFPRHEENSRGSLIRSCQRPRFAEKARYRYPRGQSEIIGPSVHLAREAARVWRNLRYGFHVVWEDDDSIQIRGWAWDLESNLKVEHDARFGKKIFRRGKGDSPGRWIVPDERELRELINKHGAIAERNCILKLLPPELVEEALEVALASEKAEIRDKLEETRKKLVAAFASIRVSASDLEGYLGHPLHESNEEEIADLRAVFASIKEGNSRWSQYVEAKEKPKDKDPQTEGTLDSILGGEVSEEDGRPKSERQPTRQDVEDALDWAIGILLDRGPISSIELGEIAVAELGDELPPTWLFHACQTGLSTGVLQITGAGDKARLEVVPKTEEEVGEDLEKVVDELDRELDEEEEKGRRQRFVEKEGLGPKDLQDDRVLPEIPFGDPALDPWVDELRAAQHLKEVDGILSRASAADGLSDQQFDSIEERARQRKEEIRDEKKKES